MRRLIILLGCTSAQGLFVLGNDAVLRTPLLCSPSLEPLTRSSATTHRDAVVAYDTYVAGGGDDIRRSTSFSVLIVLTHIRIRTPWQITKIRGAHRAVTALHTRRAVELTVDQGSGCTSLRIDVLAGRGVHTCGKVTKYRSAFGTMATIFTGGAFKLAAHEIPLDIVCGATVGDRRCQDVCGAGLAFLGTSSQLSCS